jgi:hypothetical protein
MCFLCYLIISPPEAPRAMLKRNVFLKTESFGFSAILVIKVSKLNDLNSKSVQIKN